ncbi:radial spoke head protein 6 homolog A [Agrilus planipennis]|uniref:Radial spoke head protein 6 homolog A n=1 Tax=Agrilus planipennis TaxID=224129 RepID=A0A1W4WQT0_AGRPL|nr:radial spoke head protein 6 homolog A [Agrilus planipennis]
MIYNYEDINPEDQDRDQEQLQQQEPIIPNYEAEFVSAKTFLQRVSPDTGDNMYDHLSDCLNKILAERPDNVIDFFEEYSRKVKERRHKPATDHLEDVYISPGRYTQAKRFMPLLRPPPPTDTNVDPEDEELADMSRNDMLQLLYFFEQAGIGLPKAEMFCLMLSMKKVIKNLPISSIRFWGKIHGLYKNYYVLETELKEEEYMRRNEEQNKEEEQLLETEPPPQMLEDVQQEALKALDQAEEEGEGDTKPPSKVPRPLPPIPQAIIEEVPEPPSEPYGVGVNKKVYYVTHEPGCEWVELPNVTPKQIRTARLIKKSFTGNLHQEIITWPAFDGTEKEYLRAQIARISAGTQISPLGFYTFGGGGGEEEEEEEAEEEEKGGGSPSTYNENPRFDPIPFNDMTDKSMSFWVHHTQYILPQGRTSWWNPYPSEDLGEEMGEEEEQGAEGPKAEPETGPPLLTPLSEDASLEAVPPWSVRSSSILTTEYAIAIVRSNLWPGAFCFSNQGKIFQNIYIGYGHKYIAHNFSPTPLPPVEQDYPLGPEIMEMTDPTGAEEEEWRIAHLPKPKPEKAAAEEEAEEEEEEDEDE